MSDDLRSAVLAILNYPGECRRLRDAVGSVLYDRLVSALEPAEQERPLCAYGTCTAQSAKNGLCSKHWSPGKTTPEPAEPALVATDTQARLHVTTNENIMADDFARAFSCCGGNDETPQWHCADCPEHPSCPGCGNEVCECVATPAPAGDAEVSHEEARSLIDQLQGRFGWYPRGPALYTYVAQQEARQQQAEREVTELERQLTDSEEEVARYLNTERVGLKARVKEEGARAVEWMNKADVLLREVSKLTRDVIRLGEEVIAANGQRDELSRKLEAAERALKDFESPTCSGEWLSGSGGHRKFGGCGKPAVWVEHGTGAAFCDEHGPTFRDAGLARKLEAAEREMKELREWHESDQQALAFYRKRFASLPDQAPQVKPLTRDDVKAIARAVVAEVAERAQARLCHDEPALLELAEAAKEEP